MFICHFQCLFFILFPFPTTTPSSLKVPTWLKVGFLSSPLSRFPWWASQSLCLPNHLWTVTSQIRIARPHLSLKWVTHIVCAPFYWEGLPSTSNSIQAKLSPSHQTSSSCCLLYFALSPWSLPAPFLSLVHIWAVFKTCRCCLNHNSLCIVISFRSHCHHPGSVPYY